MDYVRNLIHCGGPASRGITGKGVGVAVLDTGIFPHIDFEDRIAGFMMQSTTAVLPTMITVTAPILLPLLAETADNLEGNTQESRQEAT